MTAPYRQVVAAAEQYVRETQACDSTGHDYRHVDRVRRTALVLAAAEGLDPESTLVVELAALLHDISDYKLNGGDRAAGPKLAAEFLATAGAQRLAGPVAAIIAGFGSPPTSLEAGIVQDADRIDGLGAIGIARAFTFAGATGEPMAATLRHCRQELSTWPSGVTTPSAMELARRRWDVMSAFLDQMAEEDRRTGAFQEFLEYTEYVTATMTARMQGGAVNG